MKRRDNTGDLFSGNANAANGNANAGNGNANASIENANAGNVNADGKVRLSDFVEDPDNLSTITDRAFDRLVEKIERIPVGLTAKRIAYVTDHPAGKFVVLSGNKRLRVLKRIHGDDAEVPADWFQDISAMSQDQRDEFSVTMNIVEGKWIAKMLVAMFPKEELLKLMDDADVSAILAELPAVQQVAENKEINQGAFGDAMELKIKLTPECRVHHEKRWTGRNTSWNQDCQEKYQ